MAIAKIKSPKEKTVSVDMSVEECTEVSEALFPCLANTQLLFQKTQYYHWNVTGEGFYSLHKLFEKQYKSLQNIGDIIAERIRALGNNAPGTFAEFKKLTIITEDDQLPASWQEMVNNLIESHKLGAQEGRRALEVAEDLEDDVSANIMIDLMSFHEKSAWMLRSTVEAQ